MTEINKNVWLYDLETLKSCVTYVAVNVHTNEIVKFVLHKDKFELSELINHLNICKGQIAFNNLSFDYPILHYILIKFKNYNINSYKYENTQIIELIYNEAQRLIQSSFIKSFNNIKSKEVMIPQLDLFKIWHFDNAARKSSLKALQIAINYPNVMECTIPFDKEDITSIEVDEILEYCLNDVLSTLEIYNLTLDKIKLRKEIKSLTGINCLNYPDVKIGEEIILTNYCKLTNTNKWEIKKLRTYRPIIELNKCIFDYIEFESKEFNQLLEWFKSLVLTDTLNISKSIVYKGFKYDYGLGGIKSVSSSLVTLR